MGEKNVPDIAAISQPVGIDTYAGKVHVEWDPQAAVTPLGQLPFFISFLKVSGLYDEFIETCPLSYTSPNAPAKRDVLGTLLMSILAGHQRYSHITSIRFDSVNPDLLGMKKVISEDAARRALKSLDEEAGIAWLDGRLHRSTEAALSLGSWILDTDTTVKCLYGKQEGAVVGYNPLKKGRPSHNYHTCFMGTTRLALMVEVNHGNQHTARQVTPALWRYYDGLDDNRKPVFIRGDLFLGNEGFLSEAEKRNALYLTKLRLTANVMRLITKLFRKADWVDAGHGFEGVESSLKLTGWSKARRVVVLRRLIDGTVDLPEEDPIQLQLPSFETSDPVKRYEYSVLVTTLPQEVLSIAQLYRDRADSENCFDELKNQWGWGGYTTQDLKRCRLVSRLVAVVYNWWTLFVRLAQPQKHSEAITSRPLLLHGVARQTMHAGQTTITITSNHAKSHIIQSALQALTWFLAQLKKTAEQLPVASRMRIITRHAFRLFLDRIPPIAPLIPAPG
jgi:Transposase DDE domain group 1